MDDNRRETLLTLLNLACSPGGECWNDRRATMLLRSQSSPDELREIGATTEEIDAIFKWSVTNPGAPIAPAPAPITLTKGAFVVRVEARFESAHFLREYRGVSEPLHGHSYKVEAELAGQQGGVDKDAIAVDFVSAKKKLDVLARRLDYGCINDVPPFNEINPTAENIAAWFAQELGRAVADEHAVVKSVTIWEGPVNSVRFVPS